MLCSLFCVYKWKREVISSILWGSFILVQHNYTGYIFNVLRNQLENYSIVLEDVYKSIIVAVYVHRHQIGFI